MGVPVLKGAFEYRTKDGINKGWGKWGGRDSGLWISQGGGAGLGSATWDEIDVRAHDHMIPHTSPELVSTLNSFNVTLLTSFHCQLCIDAAAYRATMCRHDSCHGL